MPKEFSLTCLHINLSNGYSRRIELDPSVSRTWLGGRGIGTFFLHECPTADPLAEEAPLIFAAGPLTGSRIPASGRMMISAFSPLTNTVGSCSAGGGFALQMKKAGLDALHITGRSDRQVIVSVQDGDVKFEDAPVPDEILLSDFFGSMKRQGGSVAAIGPAAFKGCRYASIMVDGSSASGRGGLGLAMASKNLRAVIMKGSGVIRQARDREAEETARKDILRLFDASPAVMGRAGISRYGTGALVDLMASRRMMPTANYRRTYFEEYRSFCASRIRETQEPKHYACHGCPIACKQKSSRDIPEFETLSHFGALNENPDLPSIMEANHLCNEYGMDTITAASTLACLAEIRGERYTGETLVEKVREIIRPTRVGELLRMGSAAMAREMGAPDRSMSVKGLELPAYDPRGAYGMALAYGTSTRGGCHLRAYPIAHEILLKPVATDRFSFSGKARIIKIAEDLNAVVDSIGACKFAFLGASLEEYAKGFSAVTGLNYDTQDLLQLGDMIYCTERHINTVRGFTGKDDMLPDRFYREPGSSGPGIDLPSIDRAAFEEALGRYYRIRGCNPDGSMRDDRLQEIGICRAR